MASTSPITRSRSAASGWCRRWAAWRAAWRRSARARRGRRRGGTSCSSRASRRRSNPAARRRRRCSGWSRRTAARLGSSRTPARPPEDTRNRSGARTAGASRSWCEAWAGPRSGRFRARGGESRFVWSCSGVCSRAAYEPSGRALIFWQRGQGYLRLPIDPATGATAGDPVLSRLAARGLPRAHHDQPRWSDGRIHGFDRPQQPLRRHDRCVGERHRAVGER